MKRKEVVEEIHLLYRCDFCGYINKFAFMTNKLDETITKENELKDILESVPCRHCRLEHLKLQEKRLISRIREI